MIKDNLRKQRNLAGISQEKLAEELQVSRQTISKWENGETYPSTKHILMLAQILKCSVEDLINGKTNFDICDEDIDNTMLRDIDYYKNEGSHKSSNKGISCNYCKKIVYWVVGIATILIMGLVGIGGVGLYNNSLYDNTKNIGFDNLIDGSLNSALDEFKKDGYTQHKIVGYGITNDDTFYIKCDLDGADGPCAALIYFYEMDKGDSYECEYLDDSEFVPKGRYYEVG